MPDKKCPIYTEEEKQFSPKRFHPRTSGNSDSTMSSSLGKEKNSLDNIPGHLVADKNVVYTAVVVARAPYKRE